MYDVIHFVNYAKTLHYHSVKKIQKEIIKCVMFMRLSQQLL